MGSRSMSQDDSGQKSSSCLSKLHQQKLAREEVCFQCCHIFHLFFLQVPELQEDQYDNVFMLKRDIVPRYRMAFRKQKDKKI